MCDSEFAMNGYKLMRKDRETAVGASMGGGVMLYVKDWLKVLERKDIQSSTFQEAIWCEIICEMEKILNGICCRLARWGLWTSD